jgi:hypothetical protein
MTNAQWADQHPGRLLALAGDFPVLSQGLQRLGDGRRRDVPTEFVTDLGARKASPRMPFEDPADASSNTGVGGFELGTEERKDAHGMSSEVIAERDCIQERVE